MPEKTKILVVQTAALGYELIKQHAALFASTGLSFMSLKSVFPAVTCTAQAGFRTGREAGLHGIVANGVFDRNLRRAFFWEQSAHLIATTERIWDGFRRRGGTVGIMFWQQILGEDIEFLLSPAPIHKHHGGMIQDCYARPAGLYAQLCAATGTEFNLRHYWGPMASVKASAWISAATEALLRSPQSPDLLLTYLPHLDYALLKYGPAAQKPVLKAVEQTAELLKRLRQAAAAAGYRLLVWGDYAITQVKKAVYPNRELRRQGLLSTRQVRQMLYPDLYSSIAFAMVDHQIAHVYVPEPENIARVKDCLTAMPGVAAVLEHSALPHPRSGELIAVAAADTWFAYPWWENQAQAPDYAGHVDIHNKPGFDPAELFWGWPPPNISRNPDKVGGSHGRTDVPAAFATDLELAQQPGDIIELANQLGQLLAKS